MPSAALDAAGACYRGEPPKWWFDSRRYQQRVRVHDQVVQKACCQHLAAQIKGSRAAGAAASELELELSLDVPSSLYETIMSSLHGGDAIHGARVPSVPGSSGGADIHVVPLPAKLSAKAVPLHKVAFRNSLPPPHRRLRQRPPTFPL